MVGRQIVGFSAVTNSSRCSGGSSSVFNSESAACALARSIWSIRNTRHWPFSGRYCARSFSNRICWMEICRSGPSGQNVTKSGCEENSSGSSPRFSLGHFSRSAITSRFASQAEVVRLDFLRVIQQSRREAPRQRRFTDAFRPCQQDGLRDALALDHLLAAPEPSPRCRRSYRTCRSERLKRSTPCAPRPRWSARPSTRCTRSGLACASACSLPGRAR